ncbi:Gal-2,6-Sulfurylases II [Chondrus crispus]|uniref:Gal-2,6-Sulfurylases II n=1 Tax=Chondrus crispus TaxID=2769 RepID=R7QNN1_CHOCR|nr:Gal-2,6-Sulfurylases II [Chondrus crispus]XP_005718876.1 Gal-2,6-Sulfurylases II [Chondrus crispus]CDF38970.1 Gal-2,6-Sulfurylases II [Chondrus crispus]CDF38971.1 Gal-2,6-Sulfurylases II [Chondrus crispus]|eukprot:XP_005718875.1 Gal-2,6-Sulfurylases II [Chondrus crispus]
MNASFLFVLLLSVIAFTADAQCGRSCRFRLCRTDGSLRPTGTRVLLRGADYTRSASVCRNFPGGRTLGSIRKTGVALVESGSRTTPINRYRPNGLSHPFPPNYFRLSPLTFQRELRGVSRRSPVGNQEDFLDDLCIRLPIRNYNIQNTDGSVFRTIATSDARDCVSFQTVVRPIVVDVAWDSSDDFDLSVDGPPGSQGGRINDNLVYQCGNLPAGKEAVSFTNMVPGKYTVKLFHFNNCFNNRTRWVVNIVINGVRVERRLGRSNVDGRQVLELEFTV